MILMIIELTFIHQRPGYIALFHVVASGVSNAALSLTPYLTSGGGNWRDFYWAWLGPSILSIFMALVWYPETYFERPPMAFDGHIVAQNSSLKVKVYATWDEVSVLSPERFSILSITDRGT
jgi:hypothetical protein